MPENIPKVDCVATSNVELFKRVDFIDGVRVKYNEVFIALLTNQDRPSENGIWEATLPPLYWKRPSNWGPITKVGGRQGTVYADTVWERAYNNERWMMRSEEQRGSERGSELKENTWPPDIVGAAMVAWMNTSVSSSANQSALDILDAIRPYVVLKLDHEALWESFEVLQKQLEGSVLKSELQEQRGYRQAPREQEQPSMQRRFVTEWEQVPDE